MADSFPSWRVTSIFHWCLFWIHVRRCSSIRLSVAGPGLTDKGLLLWDRYSYGRVCWGLNSSFAAQHILLTFQHRAGVGPYASFRFQTCVFLLNSCDLFSCDARWQHPLPVAGRCRFALTTLPPAPVLSHPPDKFTVLEAHETIAAFSAHETTLRYFILHIRLRLRRCCELLLPLCSGILFRPLLSYAVPTVLFHNRYRDLNPVVVHGYVFGPLLEPRLTPEQIALLKHLDIGRIPLSLLFSILSLSSLLASVQLSVLRMLLCNRP